MTTVPAVRRNSARELTGLTPQVDGSARRSRDSHSTMSAAQRSPNRACTSVTASPQATRCSGMSANTGNVATSSAARRTPAMYGPGSLSHVTLKAQLAPSSAGTVATKRTVPASPATRNVWTPTDHTAGSLIP